MASVNSVNIAGNFVGDVGLDHSSGGTAYNRFTVAVNRPMNRNGKRGVDYVNCVSFGHTAENLSKLAGKGKSVFASGHIRSGKFQNKNGETVYAMNVQIQSFEILTPKSSSGNTQSNNAQSNTNQNTATKNGSNESAKDRFNKNSEKVNVSDDDLPF